MRSELTQLPQGRFRLIALLIAGGQLGRDRVVWVTVLASLARFALVWSVNAAAFAMAHGSGQGRAVAVLALAAAVFLYLSYVSRYRGHVVIARLQKSLRLHLSALLNRAETRYLMGRNRGPINAAMTSDTGEVALAVPQVILAFEGALVVLLTVLYLLAISPVAMVSAVLAFVVGLVGFVLFDPAARRDTLRANEYNAAFCDRVDDMLSGWRESRLNSLRAQEIRGQTGDILDELETARLRSERGFAASTVISHSAIILMMCFAVVLLPLVQGAQTDVVFQVMTVILLSYGPIEAMFNALPRISAATSAYDRVLYVANALQDRQQDAIEVEGPPDAPFTSLGLSGISLSLREADVEMFRLGPVDLDLKAGEVVFVTGGNGSGKTTLMSVLSGLQQPDQGTLLLNGQEVSGRSESWRGLFAGVFTDYHLFDRAFGLDQGQQAELSRWLDQLDLAHKVTLKDGRFSTLALSAGQKRRLALAVALAEGRPVLLLDEFTADQDPQWRDRFYAALLPQIAATGRLIIAITHDHHKFHCCNRLIRLDKGQIASDSPPQPDALTGY
jgi:putative ATP-binding cassette transporter